MVTLLHCFWACGEAEHHGKEQSDSHRGGWEEERERGGEDRGAGPG